MLWYLLFPFRGTTDAPELPPNHPLRRAFSQYARWAAQHVNIVLPLSVACAFLLIYPVFFLYTTDSTVIINGASNLPHHVWTYARPIREGAGIESDVIMRTAWVHGSYMKAIKHEVLLGGLELQDELLGPTKDFSPRQFAAAARPHQLAETVEQRDRDALHVSNGMTNESWFFHSPLQYWSGSADKILSDHDPLATVSEKKTQHTWVNTTLRHSIVFSGKRFKERRLVAADALVITLIHRGNSPVASQWIRRAEELASRAGDKWVVIPADGKSVSSQLYEFQFRPVSWIDWFLVSLAYLAIMMHLSISLAKIEALRSKGGLVMAILVQMLASMASSFTVCAILRLDVSRVPYIAYLLVVLVISMENSLRLTTAVIMNAPVVNIDQRLGQAYGETAHLALVTRVGNMLLLWVLSLMAGPGVAAFCAFAAVAITFDFLYLSTWFLLILKLDLRQRELSDVERTLSSGQRAATRRAGSANGLVLFLWSDSFARICARAVGTLVLVGIMLVMYHQPGLFTTLFDRGASGRARSSLLTELHQARTPTSWLRLQDHETARELIHVVKPWAHSYVARVFDPLVFVLKGSDRMPNISEPRLLPAVYDFCHHQMPAYMAFFVLSLVLMAALTRYLGRNQTITYRGPGRSHDEPLLSVKSLSGGHRLDIVLMAASGDGWLASAGLDRTIQMWNMASGLSSRVFPNTKRPGENPFPVVAMAIDQGSNWLALLSSWKLHLWNIPGRRWGPSMAVDCGPGKPERFFFGSTKGEYINSILVVKRSGHMMELKPDVGQAEEHVICKAPLVWAAPFTQKAIQRSASPRLSILIASCKNRVHLVTQSGTQWLSGELELADREAKDVHVVVPLSNFSMCLLGRRESVDLFDLSSLSRVHTFQTEPMLPRSLKYLCSSQGPGFGLGFLSLAYAHADSGDLILQTYSPAASDQIICLCGSEGKKGNRGCCTWAQTKETKCRVANPGIWEALGNSIMGVRKKPTTSSFASATLDCGSSLRRRHQPNQSSTKFSIATDRPTWEIWFMSRVGQYPDRSLCEEFHLETSTDDAENALQCQPLLISQLGPMVRAGLGTIAVGFGKAVKVISVGHMRFDGSLEAENLLRRSAGNRRRSGQAGARAASERRRLL